MEHKNATHHGDPGRNNLRPPSNKLTPQSARVQRSEGILSALVLVIDGGRGAADGGNPSAARTDPQQKTPAETPGFIAVRTQPVTGKTLRGRSDNLHRP